MVLGSFGTKIAISINIGMAALNTYLGGRALAQNNPICILSFAVALFSGSIGIWIIPKHVKVEAKTC